jgi:hypothetical protein
MMLNVHVSENEYCVIHITTPVAAETISQSTQAYVFNCFDSHHMIHLTSVDVQQGQSADVLIRLNKNKGKIKRYRIHSKELSCELVG